MAKLEDLTAAVADYQADVTEMLKRVSTTLDLLQKSLETRELSEEQQKALDVCYESLKAADKTVEDFDPSRRVQEAPVEPFVKDLEPNEE